MLLPGGVNLVRYHGVFAPAAKGRAAVVPDKEEGAGEVRRSRWIRWSVLLERVFGRCPDRCPTCGERMALLGMFHGDGRAIDVLEWIEGQGGGIRDGPAVRQQEHWGSPGG